MPGGSPIPLPRRRVHWPAGPDGLIALRCDGQELRVSAGRLDEIAAGLDAPCCYEEMMAARDLPMNPAYRQSVPSAGKAAFAPRRRSRAARPAAEQPAQLALR